MPLIYAAWHYSSTGRTTPIVFPSPPCPLVGVYLHDVYAHGVILVDAVDACVRADVAKLLEVFAMPERTAPMGRGIDVRVSFFLFGGGQGYVVGGPPQNKKRRTARSQQRHTRSNDIVRGEKRG